jgi:U3 small nucleolar RNA-associated protein 14
MTKKQSKRSSQVQKTKEHVSDDEDSSIASDEAFDSEDERRYGSFFEGRDKKAKTRSEIDDEASDVGESDEDDEASDSDGDDVGNDDDEEDGDGGDYMLSLLDKLDTKNQDSKAPSSDTGIAVHTKESEFAASVVKKADLTLDALMGSIQDSGHCRIWSGPEATEEGGPGRGYFSSSRSRCFRPH